MSNQPREWEIDGYIATLQPATEGLPGEQMRLEIRPKDGLAPAFSRTFYYDDASERHYQNFARKFVTDPVYRDQCLKGTAPWQEVDIRYRERAAELYTIFARKDERFLPSAELTPDNRAVHERLWTEYQTTLHRIYQWLKHRFNPPPARSINLSARGSTVAPEKRSSLHVSSPSSETT